MRDYYKTKMLCYTPATHSIHHYHIVFCVNRICAGHISNSERQVLSYKLVRFIVTWTLDLHIVDPACPTGLDPVVCNLHTQKK